MALTPLELRLKLSSDEPDYEQLAPQIDDALVLTLDQLANDPDAMLASKAVYLASLVAKPQAHRIVQTASDSSRPLVRIASASALVNLPDAMRHDIADKLLDSADVSLSKLAIKAVQRSASPQLKQKIERISQESPSELIRTLSTATLQRINN